MMNNRYSVLGPEAAKADLLEAITTLNANFDRYHPFHNLLTLDQVDLTVALIVEPETDDFQSWQVIAVFRDSGQLPFPIPSQSVTYRRARMGIDDAANTIIKEAYYRANIEYRSMCHLLNLSQPE